MLLRRILAASAVLAVLGSAPAWALDTVPHSATTSSHERAHRGLRLSPELKIMWRHETRSQRKAMPKTERHGWLKRQWASMTDAQKQAKMAELQAKWEALPPNVRQALIERKRAKREQRRTEKQGTEPAEQQTPVH